VRRFLPALVAASVVAAILLAGGLVAAARSDPTDPGTDPLGPGPVTVRLGIEHSTFDTDRIVVRPGSEVRFVVVNDDPINHELIVGPDDVQQRHESGNHAEHPPVPGEVSVGPNTQAGTTYRFDDPGEVVFACHLPGHFAYGMHGVVDVVEAPA
jgi:uncharacterized cupredoxin-like copper-binding protein